MQTVMSRRMTQRTMKNYMDFNRLMFENKEEHVTGDPKNSQQQNERWEGKTTHTGENSNAHTIDKEIPMDAGGQNLFDKYLGFVFGQLWQSRIYSILRIRNGGRGIKMRCPKWGWQMILDVVNTLKTADTKWKSTANSDTHTEISAVVVRANAASRLNWMAACGMCPAIKFDTYLLIVGPDHRWWRFGCKFNDTR